MTTKIERLQISADYCRKMAIPRTLLEWHESDDELYHGLCHNLTLYQIMSCDFILPLMSMVTFSQWEHFSGDLWYPIPHDDYPPQKAFDDHEFYGFGLWDASTKYGQLRLEFCEWCADQIELKIKELKNL